MYQVSFDHLELNQSLLYPVSHPRLYQVLNVISITDSVVLSHSVSPYTSQAGSYGDGCNTTKCRPTCQVIKNTQLVNLLITVDFTGSVLFSEEASSHPTRLGRKLSLLPFVIVLIFLIISKKALGSKPFRISQYIIIK